jgi:hypothetical protein
MKTLASLLILALALPAAGCGSFEPAVRPYERALLDDPVMDRDRDPVSSGYMRHVYECGEGARGGTGEALTSRSCY